MKDQMELGFEHSRKLQACVKRERRLRSAQWWFGQMRQVVDRALDRSGCPARPEQIYLSLSRGQRPS